MERKQYSSARKHHFPTSSLEHFFTKKVQNEKILRQHYLSSKLFGQRNGIKETFSVEDNGILGWLAASRGFVLV